MQSFVLLLDCPDRDHLQEALSVCREFLKSRTPKRRERCTIYLLDPPGSSWDTLEAVRDTGFQDRFQVVHRKDKLSYHHVLHRTDVWVTGGRIQRNLIMEEVCQRGKVLVNYGGRLSGGELQASWYFAIQEGHPLDRSGALCELLTRLYEDPEAVRWMRRYAHQHYNQYCNRVTRENLVRAMDRVPQTARRLSA